MKTRITAFGLSVLLASTAFAGPANHSAIPESAKWVVHVDVAAVTASDIANGVLNLITAKDSPVPAQDIAKAQQIWKFISNVHSVTLYGPGHVETDAIAIISAKYTDAQAMGLLKIDAQGETTVYGNHTIYHFTGKGKSKAPRRQYACFYDNTTIVVGANLAKIKAALDVLNGKAKAQAKDSPLSKMLVPSKGSFVVVAAADVNKMIADVLKDKPALKENIGATIAGKCLDFRVEMGETNDQLYVTGNASMLTEEDAATVQAMLNAAVGVAMMKMMNDEAAMKLLRAVQIDRKGKNVGVGVHCSVETILDKVSGLIAARLRTPEEISRIQPKE